MSMDVWYELLVRELTDLDRADELRQDAEQHATPDGPGNLDDSDAPAAAQATER
jgi:hypothetical protein